MEQNGWQRHACDVVILLHSDAVVQSRVSRLSEHLGAKVPILTFETKQKPARFNPEMPNQKSNAQQSSLTLSDKIRRLQQQMVRLMAHIAKLRAKQQSPSPPNLRPPAQLLAQVQCASNTRQGHIS
uniref:Uncharacterized protein n=1 Tax=Romanomermis culicivorax TaxID=13658 RepID=A0A915JBN2_ROMCU